MQSASKPTKHSKSRRNSNAPPAQPKPLVLPKRRRVLVSNPRPVQRRRSFQTSTCLRTRSCSCGTFPTISIRRHLLLCLGVSKDSWKQDWCPGERESLLWSMRMKRGLSVPRRIRRECPWGMLASLSGSRTRDSKDTVAMVNLLWRSERSFVFLWRMDYLYL